MRNIPKKIAFLYIIKIIKDGSRIDRPLNYSNIARALNKRGIKYDRKTVSRDVAMLCKTKVIGIVKVRGGCYFDKETDMFFKENNNEKGE